MIALLWLFAYLSCGILTVRFLLPRKRPVIRIWLGVALGVLLMMWLPALCAFAVSFTAAAHWLSLIPLLIIVGVSYLCRDPQPLRPASDEDRLSVQLLLWLALPLTLLSMYLIWTHDLRPAADGSFHTGQACYGDLSLHLGIITSLRNAPFPPDYSIMPGQLLSYPFLTDSFTTSFMLGGFSLRMALLLSSLVMLVLVFAGYAFFCQRLCKTKPGMFIAFLLFFLNGGLGFVYVLDMRYVSLGTAEHNSLQAATGLIDRIWSMIAPDSWYQTPTNHTEFDTYNLRWSNVIADMLIPQRTTMGGWSMLMPCLWLLSDLLLGESRLPHHTVDMRSQSARPVLNWRQICVLGVFSGMLPMIHTHSFAALAFCSFGMMLFSLYSIFKNRQWYVLLSWLLYAAIAALLAVPQLFQWTFAQAFANNEGTGTFLSFHFNWVNRYADGLKDGYLWFYLKNIGLPFVLICFCLFEKNYRTWLVYSGAFVIFILAELIRFQPNAYDNNKLFYVWYMLCLPAAADFAVLLWHKLRGIRVRPLMAVLSAVICFASGTISIAHECLSDWQLYSDEDVQTAQFIDQTLPEHAVFMTGRQHLNPVSALSGRIVVCGPDLWLYYHGFDTVARSADIRMFYEDPEANSDILEKYDVSYILVSGWERTDYSVNEHALERLYPVIFESDYGSLTIYSVKDVNLLENDDTFER